MDDLGVPLFQETTIYPSSMVKSPFLCFCQGLADRIAAVAAFQLLQVVAHLLQLLLAKGLQTSNGSSEWNNVGTYVDVSCKYACMYIST